MAVRNTSTWGDNAGFRSGEMKLVVLAGAVVETPTDITAILIYQKKGTNIPIQVLFLLFGNFSLGFYPYCDVKNCGKISTNNPLYFDWDISF